jgi:D-glycero-alpha-D-manno-heptose-7-phosphate kinase
MLIAKTPLRVSFIGGGSDYPRHFGRYGGAVIGTTIDQFVFTNLLQLNEQSVEKFRFTYRITESVSKVEDIKHPVVRTVLKELPSSERLNIGTMSTIPGGTGLGSSSAFTVGLIQLISARQGLIHSEEELAKQAVYIERNLLAEPGGYQDQYFAAYGGFNLICFSDTETSVQHLIEDSQILQAVSSHIALIPVNKPRNSSEFAKKTIKHNELPENISRLQAEVEFTLAIAEQLKDCKDVSRVVELVGILVQRSWESKKEIYSPEERQSFVETENMLKKCGALSYKICGAGSSGFFLAVFPDPVSLVEHSRTKGGHWLLPQMHRYGSQILKV